MKSRAQSALEYLMTYGWALIVIVIAVGVLVALGVFNLGGTTSTCTGLPSQFVYDGHAYKSTGSFSLRLQNGLSKPISVDFMAIKGQISAPSATIAAGSKGTVTATGLTTGAGPAGQAYSLDVNVGYDETDGLSDRNMFLKCTGKYE